MDGIQPLWIEALTRDELISQVDQYLAWSLETGYFPGKIDHPMFHTLQMLNREHEIRMAAE